MTVESATYISELDATKPGATDVKSEGDDHIRLLKSTIKATFPNVNAAVSATDEQLSGTGSAFTNATANTQATSDNSTYLATTAFAQALLASVAASSGALTPSVASGASIAFTAGQKVACTYAGTVTYTLPATATLGARVGVIVANARTDTVISRNGSNIMGLAGDMTVDDPYASFELIYLDSSNGWWIA